MATIDLGEDLMPMALGFGDNRAGAEERNSDGLVHYQGELGDFWYDPKEFDLEHSEDRRLHYVGSGLSVSLPTGCISTRYMFHDCTLPEGFQLIDFNTSKVVDMAGMFAYCTLPAGFSLGEKFDTSNVTNMYCMFEECKMSKDFSLGDNFDTSSVTDMSYMFYGCKLPEGFTLGDKFSTSNVTNMYCMFEECKMPEDFSLGDKFDTGEVEAMAFMFQECEMPAGFTLGDKFSTSNVTNMEEMFRGCELPDGFTLGEKFDTSNVTCMRGMFQECVLSGDSTFANISGTETKIDYLREKCQNTTPDILKPTASEDKTLLNDFLKVLGKKPDEYFWLQLNYEKLSKEQLLSIITSFMVVIEGNALEKLYDKVRDNYKGN